MYVDHLECALAGNASSRDQHTRLPGVGWLAEKSVACNYASVIGMTFTRVLNSHPYLSARLPVTSHVEEQQGVDPTVLRHQ